MLNTTQEIAVALTASILALAFEAYSLPAPFDGAPCRKLFSAARATLDAAGLNGDVIVDLCVENGEYDKEAVAEAAETAIQDERELDALCG